jgi:Collagen triple helix repeat (20 copies)
LQPSDVLTVLALIRKEVGEVTAREKGDPGKDGPQGPQGPQGDRGPQGSTGPQGIKGDTGPKGDKGDTGLQGDTGPKGNDGKDGTNGANGVSIRDVYVDPDDGDLYVELTNSRLINAGHVKGNDGKPGKDGRNGVMVGGGGSTYVPPSPSGMADTFETVSKNLSASGAVMNYTGADLTSIVYTNGVIKTLAYSIDGLASVTLSGNTPSGIALTKTLNYSGGNLVGFNYS